MLCGYKKQTFKYIEGLLFVLFEKKLDHIFCFSHSIFMISYLEIFFLCMFYAVIVYCAEVDLLQLSNEPLK